MTETALSDPIAPPRRWRPNYRAWLNRLGVLCWCVAVFLSCVKLYTLHNDFSIDYHPDEGTKVEQIQHDERNFNHPLLLLEATQHALPLQWPNLSTDPDENRDPILQTGRDVSAVLAATCVTGFALAGYFAAGWPGMVLASIAVGLCPSLQVYAHYMKEDAALASGIGVTVAGMAWVWNRKTVVAQLLGPMLAGTGAAMAASGKYVGVMAAVGALLAVIFAPWRRWYWLPIRLILCAAVAVGLAAAINHRALEQWDDFKEGFNHEYEHGTTEHSGLTLPRPSRFIFEVTRMETQPHIQIFAIALLLAMLSLRRHWGWDLIIVLFSLACLATLSMGAIPFHRYALPVVILAHFLAATGAARWVEQLTSRPKWFVPAAVAAIVLFGWQQGVRSYDVNNQFANDSRDRLIQWANSYLAPRTRIAEDSYAPLRSGGNLRLRVFTSQSNMAFAPQYGTLEQLRSRGISTVIVCSSNYDRYFEPAAMGAPGEEDDFNYRRDWYTRLFREGKLLWQAKAEHPTYSFTNPNILVYSIREKP